MRALLGRWWFGDAFVLAVCAGVLVAAALLTPSSEVVRLFGVDVPVVCTFRRLFDMPCPGCGLTRSFSFMAHGRLLDGFRSNPLGPVLFLLTASQVPYRLLRLHRGRRERR